jgi:CheY-like chemotaxis protein
MVPDGLDGFMTMQQLRAVDPKAKGILSSGYPDQDSEARIAAGFTDVIGKPYELKTLRETLERVLGKTPASA